MKIFDIKGGRWRRVLIPAVVLVVYCVFLSLFYHFMRGDVFPYESFGAGLKIYLLNLIPTSILTLANAAIIFNLLEKSFVSKYLPLKIAADFAVSIGMMYFLIWLFTVANRPFRPDIAVDSSGVLLHNVLIVMTLEILYYVKRSRAAHERAEYARREALRYQYDALKAQINPHFLFNSFNILLSLISIDTKKAGEFTMALSQIYRYVLSIQNKISVPLADELEFLRSYISILEIRYNRFFHVEVKHLAEVGEECHIVPFTLQLLVENVTKHNVISSRHPMRVEVVVHHDHVSVSNPVTPKKIDEHTSSRIGLKYIAEQYRINGKEFHYSGDGKNFTATIPYIEI